MAMIEPGEYEVRILRAFGTHHRGDVIAVPMQRGVWLLKHKFAEAVKKGAAKQKQEKQPPPDGTLDLSA